MQTRQERWLWPVDHGPILAEPCGVLCQLRNRIIFFMPAFVNNRVHRLLSIEIGKNHILPQIYDSRSMPLAGRIASKAAITIYLESIVDEVKQ
jgi:hypothetical protein